MKVRMSQHGGVSFRTNRPLGDPINSKIYEHFSTSNHSFSQNNFTLIDGGSGFDLRILESIHISKLNPSLNNRLSSYDLLIVR